MATFSITLRAAEPGDIDAVDRLLAASYPRLLRPYYPPSVMVTAVPFLARANPKLLASGRYYLAETPSGEIIGAGGWSRVAGQQEVAEVRHLVTDHRHVRKGIARRIMMAVFAEAKSAGTSHLSCQSTLAAVPFYRSLGFEEVGRATVQLQAGIDFEVLRMIRAI